MSHRAVVVDDEPDLRDLIGRVLTRAGMQVHTAATGAEAIRLVREHDPDLVTLDLSLPDLDGTDVCREIRAFSDAYVVMITGRSEEIDRLVGLEVGADDYMSKPFSPRELTARTGALLRRPRAGRGVGPEAALAGAPPTTPAAPLSGLQVDPGTRTTTLDGAAVPLTPSETELLVALMQRPGVAWSREDLVREVWRGDFIESDFLVDVHVGSLRRKLQRAGSTVPWIRTVDGAAYAFHPG